MQIGYLAEPQICAWCQGKGHPSLDHRTCTACKGTGWTKCVRFNGVYRHISVQKPRGRTDANDTNTAA